MTREVHVHLVPLLVQARADVVEHVVVSVCEPALLQTWFAAAEHMV